MFSEGLHASDGSVRNAAALSNELGIAVYTVVLGHADLVKRLALAEGPLGAARQAKQTLQPAPRVQGPANSKKNNDPPTPPPTFDVATALQRSDAGSQQRGASQVFEQLRGQELAVENFKKLGGLTGGQTYDPPTMNLEMLTTIFRGIVLDARTQYGVGFNVEAAANPKKYKMEVRLADSQKGTVRGGQLSVGY